jgi:hypothetical protein
MSPVNGRDGAPIGAHPGGSIGERRYDVQSQTLSLEPAMCTSYEPNPKEDFDAFGLFPKPDFDYQNEIYKDYLAPIFRRDEDSWRTDPATFGMVPRNCIPSHIKAFDTMNARAES